MKPNKDQEKQKGQNVAGGDQNWQKQQANQPSKTTHKDGGEEGEKGANEEGKKKIGFQQPGLKKGQDAKYAGKTSDDDEDEDELPEVPSRGKQDDPGRTKRDEPK